MAYHLRHELRHNLEHTLEMGLEIRHEIELKIGQSLTLALQHSISPEFQPYITIDNDDDLDLLKESFTFLTLHEFGHQLQANSRVIIPPLADSSVFNTNVIRQQAREIAIDKSAYLAGTLACHYKTAYLVNSHCALLERIIRDTLDIPKFSPMPELYARSIATLESYAPEVSSRTYRRIHRICDRLRDYFLLEGTATEQRALIEAYTKVFQETTVIKKG